MNRGQSISGPRDALMILFPFLFIACISCSSALLLTSLLLHHRTDSDIPTAPMPTSLQLWPSTQTGGLSLGPGFVFSEMRLSLANFGPNACHQPLSGEGAGLAMSFRCSTGHEGVQGLGFSGRLQ